jgi:hypothetical protein
MAYAISQNTTPWSFVDGITLVHFHPRILSAALCAGAEFSGLRKGNSNMGPVLFAILGGYQ